MPKYLFDKTRLCGDQTAWMVAIMMCTDRYRIFIQEMRAVQRVTEKRKLFDFDSQAIEMIQCTQRRRKLSS